MRRENKIKEFENLNIIIQKIYPNLIITEPPAEVIVTFPEVVLIVGMFVTVFSTSIKNPFVPLRLFDLD
jgi:hypothetical protein